MDLERYRGPEIHVVTAEIGGGHGIASQENVQGSKTEQPVDLAEARQQLNHSSARR
jgi:hypothetical protein